MKENQLLTKRLMTLYIASTLLFSMVIILPSTDLVHATNVVLYTNGAGDVPLTCGDEITLQVIDGSLWPEHSYYVAVQNTSGSWIRICSSKSADVYGDIELTFRVPGWNDVGCNPLPNHGPGHSTNGQWSIAILNASSGGSIVSGTNTTITISNLYDIYFKYDGKVQTSLFYNTSLIYPFEVYVRNWTGYNSGWDDTEQDEDLWIDVYDSGYNPIYTNYHLGSQSKWSWVIDPADVDYKLGSMRETYLIFNVTGGTDLNSSIRLPILLNMTTTVPTGAIWGDTITISGYLKDGQDNAIPGYRVDVYAPASDGAYISVYNVNTYSNGAFSMSIETGTGNSGCAGTWYIGTYATDGFPRVNMSEEFSDIEGLTGFIAYDSFEVATKNNAIVKIETTDDIITGFPQTVNISIYNSSWMNSDTDKDMYKQMKVHITGVDNYNNVTGETYDKDDIVEMTTTLTKFTSKYAYYEFTWTFNETGTITIWVSHENNLSMIAYSDTVSYFFDSYYDDKIGLLPNVTGMTSFTISEAEDINIDTVSMPTSVGLTTDCGYKNLTTNVTIVIYGETSGSYRNASIQINGCGVDVTIAEDDPNANDGSYGQTSEGVYWAKISPKTAGTITITATNETDDVTISKDYAISGLIGTVTTELGGDKNITCGSTEKITVSVTNGQYATVKLAYYDRNWENCNLLNETTGDNTAREGLNGIFEFTPDEEDLENVGYIVVGVSAGSNLYMYDIIEVEPIHDLTVMVKTPTMGNQTLTVGLDQDIIVEVKGPTGSFVTADSPTVTGYLLYEDHTKDTTDYIITFSNYGTGTYKASLCGGGDGWLPYAGQFLIEVVNNTNTQEHDGTTSLDVDQATVTYSPGGATAGIQERNVTVAVTVTDANGNPLANEYVWFYVENNTDTSNVLEDFKFNTADDDYVRIRLDKDGKGEFDIRQIGDKKTFINCSMQQHDPADGQNTTMGIFYINYPTFTVDPDTIFIGQPNSITLIAKDYNENPINGINLTFVSSIVGILSSQPDPVQTDENGQAILSVSPQSSGKLNLTIARDLRYINGRLNWTDAVITDTYVTATSMRSLRLILSKTTVYQGESLTVTVTSNNAPVSGSSVEFSGVTLTTDATGKATFTAPDPGVESVVYVITAEKTGYLSTEKSVTVIKVFEITVIGPTTNPKTDETFTVTVIAKGTPLAGATISFNDETFISGGDGKLSLVAPSKTGEYPLTAAYGTYKDQTMMITVEEGNIVPGFEVLIFVIAIGLVAILLIVHRKR